MPESPYIQQAISTTQQRNQAIKRDTVVATVFTYQMQKKMMEQVYNSTRSNLGF